MSFFAGNPIRAAWIATVLLLTYVCGYVYADVDVDARLVGILA
jgi:hypothetical protein